MMQRYFLLSITCSLLLVGCSSGEKTAERARLTAAPTPPPEQPVAFQSVKTQTESLQDTVLLAVPDTSSSPADSLISAMLEKARQHYLSAIAAEQNGDSVRSAAQFEESIAILNDLSYFPEIENNKDFNDLTRTVVEDYEQYIAKIDTLSPQSSIFALRAKLSQFTEGLDTLAATTPTQIVQGTIPLVVNNLVERNISFFQGRGRHHMDRWLGLQAKYFPFMRKILKEEGVPEEIVNLSMVESGINPLARSWARAVGMWQFVKGTGRLYGLRANYWYDERRDIEKSTRAMARHIKDLHEEFGDWYLALAAYNSGAGRVYRGIRRSGSTDYFEMRRKLPRETRNYVPQFIAVSLITLKPAEYGFEVPRGVTPFEFDTVTVNDCVDLEVLARAAGTDVWALRDLNTELIQWCTPPGMKEGYVLRIPPGTRERFRKEYAAIPDDQKRDWIVHVVKKGETLGSIAKRYGIPAGLIQEANRLASTRLSVKKPLAIPVPRGVERYASLVAASAKIDVEGNRRGSRRTTRPVADRTKVAKALARYEKGKEGNTKDYAKLSYRVKKGDTMGHIAEWYGCRAADIRNWNDIAYGENLRAGASLTIWVRKKDMAKYDRIDGMTFAEKEQMRSVSQPSAAHAEEKGEKTYLVKKGDSLDKIAREYGVSIAQIKRWNNLRKNRISAGQELVIYAEASGVKDVTGSKAAPPAQAQVNQAGSAKTITYIVKRGDTIWNIAKLHAVRLEDLRTWNDIRRNKIVEGQELVIHLN
jgi:membrane-bound lytic murein transglycosylase D